MKHFFFARKIGLPLLVLIAFQVYGNFAFAKSIQPRDTTISAYQKRLLQIEERKLELEREKIQQQIITAIVTTLAIFISIGTAFFTIRISRKTLASRKELIQMLINNPEKYKDIIGLWRIAFRNSKNLLIDLQNIEKYYQEKEIS